jgi:hypothetical protein
VVVRLNTMEARVRVAGGLQVGFLGESCHVAAEVAEGYHKLVAGVIVDVGLVLY